MLLEGQWDMAHTFHVTLVSTGHVKCDGFVLWVSRRPHLHYRAFAVKKDKNELVGRSCEVVNGIWFSVL